MEKRGSELSLLDEILNLSNEETPFPWQEELLKAFLQGTIPPAIDIPTGLGKTSVMAIWLAARAQGTKLPRRLVYVVDRRAVVDQATEVAVSLRDYVARNLDFREKLGLSDSGSLPISTLRGQHVDNRDWLEDPTSPAIIVGTVDMIGSRLLFEGYGVSRKMRPYHAGLLGVDTLIVLDEAHLVPPFEQLLRTIAGDLAFRPRQQEARQIVPPFVLLSLSATGRSIDTAALTLTCSDLQHPTVQKRLNAKKLLTLQPLQKGMKLEEELARCAWELTHDGTRPIRCIVFCDQRKVAEKARAAVENLARGHINDRTELLVGGRRVFEREHAMRRLTELGFIAGSQMDRKQPAFLFATSAGEVGIDLDADHMVCDLVAWERMVQRLGRVNRRGDGDARVIVIVKPEPDAKDQEQEAVDVTPTIRSSQNMQAPFQRLPRNGDFMDASPGALRDLKQRARTEPELQQVLDGATTSEPLRPALTGALVEAWAMTSLTEHTGRPSIDPWLRGWQNDPPQTAIVWRTHLPVRTDGRAATPKEIERFFEAAPPHTSEFLEIETNLVIDWLKARTKALFSPPRGTVQEESHRQDGTLGREETVALVLAPDGSLRGSLLGADLITLEGKATTELKELLAGATLIVDARLGGLKTGLLANDEAAIPRTIDDGQEWLEKNAIPFRVRYLQVQEDTPSGTHWRERFRLATEIAEDGEVRSWLIVEKWRHDAATEDDRSAGHPQLLGEHQAWVEARVRRFAKALGLHDYEEVLALAALLHDEGKRARIWQRAFNATGNEPCAKTLGPINYALLNGYRHELGSLIRVEQDPRLLALSPGQRDLALHLIAAHHGFARPAISTQGCEDAPPSLLEGRAREIALRFAWLQARWGPWGLAWWEALLRAADQQASRDNDGAESPLKGGDV